MTNAMTMIFMAHMLDGGDVATHFLLRDDARGEAPATARLLDKPGAAKIGRVAVLSYARGRGLGFEFDEAGIPHFTMRKCL